MNMVNSYYKINMIIKQSIMESSVFMMFTTNASHNKNCFFFINLVEQNNANTI